MSQVGDIIVKNLRSALAVLALLPGAAVLIGLLTIPENVRQLCYAICGVLSLTAVLLVFFVPPSMSERSRRRVVLSAVVAVLLGVFLFASYFFFLEHRSICVAHQKVAEASTSNRFKCVETLMLPLSPSGKLEQMARAQAENEDHWDFPENYEEVFTTTKRQDLIDEVQMNNDWSETLAVILLVLSQLLLTIPIVIIAALIPQRPKPATVNTPPSQ